MSRATPEYIALETKVLGMIKDLKPDFPGTMQLTVSDETYAEMRYMLDLGTKLKNKEITEEDVQEQLRKLRSGEIKLSITGQERREILTYALPNVVYSQDNHQKRVGELHFVKKPWEIYTLDPSFQPYAAIIQEKYM